MRSLPLCLLLFAAVPLVPGAALAGDRVTAADDEDPHVEKILVLDPKASRKQVVAWLKKELAGVTHVVLRAPAKPGNRAWGRKLAEALADTPEAKGLVSLHIIGQPMGAKGATALARSKNLVRLEELALRGGEVSDEGARAIAKGTLSLLRTLDLADNDVGPDGAAALAESVNLDHLEAFDLERNHIGDEGAAAIAGSRYLVRVSRLRLRWNDIAVAGAKALGAAKHLTSGHPLDAWGSAPGSKKLDREDVREANVILAETWREEERELLTADSSPPLEIDIEGNALDPLEERLVALRPYFPAGTEATLVDRLYQPNGDDVLAFQGEVVLRVPEKPACSIVLGKPAPTWTAVPAYYDDSSDEPRLTVLDLDITLFLSERPEDEGRTDGLRLGVVLDAELLFTPDGLYLRRMSSKIAPTVLEACGIRAPWNLL